MVINFFVFLMFKKLRRGAKSLTTQPIFFVVFNGDVESLNFSFSKYQIINKKNLSRGGN